LPEGGEAVGIADLIGRLKRAIEFAKNCGELKRDDAARELWANVYPALSEGKTGLLGAITARAEAQVLRLSGLYALLDCSKVVRVAHLKAALALWDYCERSAAWVFETGTGNKTADRILAALRVTREKGLIKSEITGNVFNRNVPRFEIDEALRLLHELNLATCKREETGGRPSERWFYKDPKHEVNEESPPTDPKTADTSYSSYVEPSQNANSAKADTDHGKPESEAVCGDLQL
jgi:DNA replicative helicase MCM subunit Mcm2 (Cdc46/Mcm family)